VAIKADGTLWSWGDNTKGQLGDGSISFSRSIPAKIGTDTNWAAVAAGDFHTMALKTDGSLWAWGDNSSGQVGNGAVLPAIQTVPARIVTGADWAAIAAGGNHSVARKTDQTLWCWGSNAAGQLGNGTAIDAVAPVQIILPAPFINTDWSAIAAGRSQSAAIKQDGSLWSWGDNSVVRPLNLAIYVDIPTLQTGGAASWLAVSIADSHILGRGGDGTLWSWGKNENGQLGHGNNFDAAVPGKIGTDTDWVAAAAGSAHSVAMKANGTVWSWGNNTSGQLGDGTNSPKNAPIQVNFATPVSISVTADNTSPQASGTTISFNAAASGGAGNFIYQFWLKDTSGVYTLVQPFSTANIWNWNTAGLPQGSYYVAVQAKTAGTTPANGFDVESVSAFVLTPQAVTAMDILTSHTSPQTAGQAVSFTAVNVSGGSGSYAYQFWLKDLAGLYTLVQPYSPANVWQWITTGMTPGEYHVAVQVKSVGSTAPGGFDLEKVVNFVIIPPPVQSMDITVTPVGPQLPGTRISIAATNVTGGSAANLYQFWLKDTSGVYTLVQPYSSSNLFDWNTAGILPGVYAVAVQAKSSGSTSGYDVEKVAAIIILTPPAATLELQITPDSPQSAGIPVSITATAGGGSGSYQYQFWLKDTSGVYSLMQSYSSSNIFNWDTTGLPAGTYSIAVQAQSLGSATPNGFDVETVANFEVL